MSMSGKGPEQHVFEETGGLVSLDSVIGVIRDATLRRGPKHIHDGDDHHYDDELNHVISSMGELRERSQKFGRMRRLVDRIGYNPRDNLRAMAEYGKPEKPPSTETPTP